MVQLLGNYQFLRQVMVALLSLCLAVPVPLFGRCTCEFGGSCCAVHLTSKNAQRPLPSETTACCEHCKPVETPTRANCCSELESQGSPASPCHCLMERIPDLSLSNSTDCLGLSPKSVASSYAIPFYYLPVLVKATLSVESIPTRYPPSHQERQSLLGTWLN